MRRFVLLALGLSCVFFTGCISLFSEIHNETHHHVNSAHFEELEHRIDELEERLHHLSERLEGEVDFEEEDEEEER